MKQAFIKILSLILVFATLMPVFVACKDPQNNGEGGGEGGENGGGEGGEGGGGGGNGDLGYQPPANLVHANKIGEDVIKIVDFQNDVIDYGKLTNPLTQKDGNTVFTYELKTGENTALGFPEAIDIGHHYFVEFTVYSDEESTTEFDLRLPGCEAAIRIKLDFKGSRRYKIKQDAFSVKNPYRIITGLQITNVTGSGKVYISNIVATNPIYELAVPEGVNISDPSIYEPILVNYRKTLVGPSEKQTKDPYPSRYSTIEKDAKNSWDLFKETKCGIDEPEKLFKVLVYNQPDPGYGVPAVCGSNIITFYQNVYNMACGYATPGCSYYKKAELLDDILFCLEYGFKHYYGESILNDGITHGNWWPWDIGIPTQLLNTLVLIKNDIDHNLVLKYKSPFDKILPYPLGSAGNLLAMARYVLISAALEGDAMRIAVVNEYLQESFLYIDKLPEGTPFSMGDGGFYSDGSFIQHTATPYLGSYGGAHFQALAVIMYITTGTVFEIHGESVDNQFEFIFNNVRPLLYDDSLMAMVSGRNLGSRNMERQTFLGAFGYIVAMRSYATGEYRARLDSLIKSMISICKKNSLDWKPYVGIGFLEDALEIEASQTIEPEKDYNLTKVMGAMDRIVQHTPKYGVGIALSSTRIYKYESINEANEIGWYHGDGMIFIYTDGIDYGFHYFFYANPYLMPGTTVNLAERNAVTLYPAMYGSSPYAGGVEQGKYGSAGYINGYPETALNSGTFKDKTNKNIIKITAKKSYFMFDNEIICIGSDINDYSGADVVTVVDNRIWGIREHVSVTDTLHINGEPINSPATVETKIDARTMHFTNMGGYVFLRADENGKNGVDKDGNVLTYKKATNKVQPGIDASQANLDSKMSFLEITLNHGKGDGKLNGDKYYYAYLPESTVEETEDYYADPDVILLKRTANIHAVLEKTLGIVACNFFASGTNDTVTVKDASTAVTAVSAETLCALMIAKNENGETVISASDPTQSYKSITFSVTLDHAPSVISTDNGVSATIEGNTVKITINTANSYGATFNLIVK